MSHITEKYIENLSVNISIVSLMEVQVHFRLFRYFEVHLLEESSSLNARILHLSSPHA